MCGRYRLEDPKRAFDWLGVTPGFEFRPRYNIAPSQRIAVMPATGQIEEMTWGIIPIWGQEKGERTLTNARCESVRGKRSFKAAFAQRRCLAPADGFYEWARVGKRPHFFTIHGGAPFALAGIWDPAPELNRCCLLTTPANALIEPLHDRMPVIVRREDWADWLSGEELLAEIFEKITAPYAADAMDSIAVSPLVNSARKDEPACCAPTTTEGGILRNLTITRNDEEGQGFLF